MPFILDTVHEYNNGKMQLSQLQACVSQVRTAVTPEVQAVHSNNL